MKNFTDTKIFQLGVKLKCPICTQKSWYSINEIDYELQCGKCSQQFEIPSHSPKEIRWAYKALPPFNLPRKAYGVYSVLLTLRFFSQLLDSPTTPLLSFDLERNNKKIEVDLGLLYQESKFDIEKIELIFAECKTFNPFTHNDVKKMLSLAKEFPDSFLVFATLRKSLKTQEKILLKKVVDRGRRYWERGGPFNNVIILTGTELFANQGPPYSWQEAGGKHAAIAKSYRERKLTELSDITNQLYLDSEPMYKFMEKQIEKIKKKA